MNKLIVTFAIIFGSIGFLISLIFSLFSKNPIFSIIINIITSTIISIILGVVVYYILKEKVPELLEIFESSYDEGRGNYEDLSDDFSEEGMNYNETESDGTFSEENQESSETVNEELYEKNTINENFLQDRSNKGEKIKKFGDHILVDKISIKNEPKLMAEAIRTMLSKDES